MNFFLQILFYFSLFSISNPFQIFSQDFGRKSIIDSIQQLPSEKEQIEAYLHHSKELWFKDLHLSESLSQKALKLSQKNNFDEGIIKSYLSLGNIHNFNTPTQAYLYYEKAQEIARKNNYDTLLVHILTEQADFHIRWLQYDAASKCIGEVIRLISQKKLEMDFPYFSMAHILEKQNKIEESIKYFKKGIETRLIHNEKGVAGIYSDLGNLFYYQQQYDSARSYYFKGYAIAQKYDLERDLGYLSDNIGLSLYKQNKLKEALIWHHKGLKHRRKAQTTLDIIANLNNISKTYLALNQYDSAYQFAKESYQKSISFKDNEFLREVTENLANIYAKKNNMDSAFFYEKLAYQYLYSINEEQKKQSILGASSHIEAAKQVFENELLKSKNNQLFWLGIILSIFLVSILSTGAYIFYQNKKQKKILEQLQEANATKDRLFSIIGHDLRSPIGSLKSLLDLVINKDITIDEFYQFSDSLKANTEHILFTLNNLLEWANSQMKGVYIQKQKLNLWNVAQENFELLLEFSKNKEITLTNLIDKNIEVNADINHLKLIFRNLLTNSIKFTEKKGEVIASSYLKDSFCVVSIKDNGIGMNENLASKIFQSKSHYLSREGTNREKGTGLGLMLCKEFIEKNGGKIWLETKENEGTTFFFSLPLSQKE
jgi:signal transduction histidine kinase